MEMSALQKGVDAAFSPPSTPNSCSSSLANQHSCTAISTPSPNTPSPATPTQLPLTPLQQPYNSQSNNNTSIHATTGRGSGAPGSSGHKNSLKGTKLARRARSFKDDLFEKISLMRTPTNTLGRSHSPNSPRNKGLLGKAPPTAEEVAKSSQSLETHVKDISNALKHFRDVILKKKLEVLPGNGTVILETIASMYAVIQSYMLNENSTVMLSATQQVYQSLGKLIKLCDEVMLNRDENNECASLSNENVKEVVDLLEDAVRNLVLLAQQKLKEKQENAFKYGPTAADVTGTAANNHLMRPPVEVAGQRTSLPDITLTPKERDILEKTKSNPIRASHSTESILRDTSPPPKPPLPNRATHPPPLPPKRRHQQQMNSNNISLNSDLDCSSDFSLTNYHVDHLSVRSRSPDENSSQCSLDSSFNHSREEDELKTLGLEHRLDDSLSFEDGVEKMFNIKNQSVLNKVAESAAKDFTCITRACIGAGAGSSGAALSANPAAMMLAGITNVVSATATVMSAAAAESAGDNSGTAAAAAVEKPEMRKTTNNRHSNESGFVSMNSFRTSTQSVSKRSSEYSFQSSTKSCNADLNCTRLSTEATTTAAAVYSSSSSTMASIETNSSHNHLTSTSSITEQRQQQHFTAQMSTNTTSSSSFNSSHSYVAATSVNHLNENCAVEVANSTQGSEQPIKANSIDIATLHEQISSTSDLLPPALPPKCGKRERTLSQYDNFDELDDSNNSVHEMPELRQHQHLASFQWQSKHQSLIEPRRAGLASSCNAIGMDGNTDLPPPLPMKKKHILAYMEICSASTRSTEQHRHTMHTYNMNRNITHSQTMNIVPLTKECNTPESDMPPALPPKNYKQRRPSANPTLPPTIITTPPPSPKPTQLAAEGYIDGGIGIARHGRVLSGTIGNNELMSTVCEELADLSEEDQLNVQHAHDLPNELNQKHASIQHGTAPTAVIEISDDLANEDDEGIQLVLERNSYDAKQDSDPQENIPNLIEEIDITPYLVLKKEGEDGPDVKGGYIDALIVHASRVQKICDNAFSEAFITTFRTFIQPIDVIEKLTHRYTVFFCQLNDQKQKAAKETFSLLVRVVNDLTSTDLTSQLLTLLVEFVYQLVCSGQLYLAKLLRNTIVEKVKLYKELKYPSFPPGMHSIDAHVPSLLDLKSVEIAEQMTLLDAELFQKIEIPEVLLFAKEQCEEKSPNLNKFTEHFNKMSFWARSKILELTDAKDREKHVLKFIKIMKHLRKMNNYNSYLALLSALDSAPIRRLEWQKTITEGLKEYCTLIDSSSSFRVYRQALAETNPPCIPYIGLVLQDLTFVHVGNPDYLKKDVINFSKRWQQHNIIVNMKRFKKCAYPFRRNERIIRFFDNFEQFLGEEEMWQISETIKPRGRRPAHI